MTGQRLELTLAPFTNAACAGADPADFFPEGGGLAVQYAERRAKAICAGCPAQTACLQWQLDFEEGLGPRARFGVFGNTNGEERHRIARGVA